MKKTPLLLLMLLGMSTILLAQDTGKFEQYHQVNELNTWIQEISKAHPRFTKIHLLGTSYAGVPVQVLEIGPETQAAQKTIPAIFVGANFEGDRPLASEGALYLAEELLQQPEHFQKLSWYILALPHPDGMKHVSSKPIVMNSRNARPFNDDMDDAVDEDGPEDLNGDGIISQMRVKDPSGTLLPDTTDARKLRRPDASKGERGLYKIYTEGIDNDGDGKYNEDGVGGTNIGISFPHLFKYHGAASGLWAGQEDEVYGLLQFMRDHPEIALVMNYGSTNFCLQAPKGGRKGGAAGGSFKVPRRYAGMIGADPNQNYSMAQVITLMKAAMPGSPVDESTVAGMLGLGPAVNPLPDDLKFYKTFNEEYKKYLKKQGISDQRLDPEAAKDGSFELWVYYHLGLPVFSQDFWAFPLLKEKGKREEEKGKKEDLSLKAEDKSEVKGKKVDKELAFFAYSDSVLGGAGFVEWTAYDHPQLGMVEIGGTVPYADLAPQSKEIKGLLEKQVPWVFELAEAIPSLEIEAEKVKDMGEGIYQVEVWFRNSGKLPYPTAMGKRNKTPVPAAIIIEGKELTFLSGRKRTVLNELDAGKNTKKTWMIRSPKSNELTIKVAAVNAFDASKTINLGGN